MSEPYDEHLFECKYCGGWFISEEMVQDEHYCKVCFKLLKEKGEI